MFGFSEEVDAGVRRARASPSWRAAICWEGPPPQGEQIARQNSIRTSQETHHVSATEPNRLMLFAVGRMQGFRMSKQLVDRVTSGNETVEHHEALNVFLVYEDAFLFSTLETSCRRRESNSCSWVVYRACYTDSAIPAPRKYLCVRESNPGVPSTKTTFRRQPQSSAACLSTGAVECRAALANILRVCPFQQSLWPG
jgi:hypothetical protein